MGNGEPHRPTWGRGIEKINRECREHGVEPPAYDFGMAGLMVTFHANPFHLKEVLGKGVRLDEKLGKNRAAIVRLMKKNSHITVSELATALRISRTAADKNIQILKSKGYIRRKGPAKGGHWDVLK